MRVLLTSYLISRDQHWANATQALGRKNVYAYRQVFKRTRAFTYNPLITIDFRFNVPNPVTLASNPWMGVMHASDVYFLFDGAT